MKKFNALPTESRVRDLTPIQIVWIIQNMKVDADIEENFYKHGNRKGETVTEFESDKEAIEEINQLMREGKI